MIIHDATYWDLTATSDHHKPLLLRLSVSNPPVDKPVSQCELRLPEHHLPPVALTKEQSFAYGKAVHAALQSGVDPAEHSERWLRNLQLAMYEWADAAGLVEVRRHDRADPESRPRGETKEDGDAAPMRHSREMLPDPEDALRFLAEEAGLPEGTPLLAVKREWTKNATAVKRSRAGRKHTRK